jgi:two-component system, sensor histidine kinase PdtaS
MSMVHEVLYNSESLEGVEMQPYCERLVEYLSNLYDGAYRGISWVVDAGAVRLDLERAIPVALIVNELVSNAYKHAFPDGRRGAFRISARAEGGSFRFEVEDDGVGLGAAASGAPIGRGIGTDLVVALAAQIKGEASFSAGRSGSGTLVAVGFPA